MLHFWLTIYEYLSTFDCNIFLNPTLNLLMKQLQQTTKKSITNIIILDIAQYNKKYYNN